MGSSSATTVSTLGSSSENVAVTNEERPTHIAFGKKVAIPNHILASRKQVILMSNNITHTYMY